MKKALSLVLAIVMALSMCGCMNYTVYDTDGNVADSDAAPNSGYIMVSDTSFSIDFMLSGSDVDTATTVASITDDSMGLTVLRNNVDFFDSDSYEVYTDADVSVQIITKSDAYESEYMVETGEHKVMKKDLRTDSNYIWNPAAEGFDELSDTDYVTVTDFETATSVVVDMELRIDYSDFEPGYYVIIPYLEGSEQDLVNMMSEILYNNVVISVGADVKLVTGKHAKADPDSMTVEFGSSFSELDFDLDVDRDYIFKGWYLDEDFREEFDEDEPITEDITLYAKIVEKKHADHDSIVIPVSENAEKEEENPDTGAPVLF